MRVYAGLDRRAFSAMFPVLKCIARSLTEVSLYSVGGLDTVRNLNG
jgi:hypothetical protein